MNADVQHVLDWLRELGSIVEMRAAADRGATPRLETNAHIHLPPNFSAFESVKQAVDLAREQGISVLGASNYYDYDVYRDFSDLARDARIFPLFGLEIIARIEALAREGTKINDPGNPGKIYVCGKAITRFAPMTAEAARLLDIIRRNDAERMTAMIAKMEGIFSKNEVPTGLTGRGVADRVAARHAVPRASVFLQERHICQAFQERFFEMVSSPQRPARLATIFGVPPHGGPDEAVKLQNEIRSHLMKSGKPAFVEETYVSFDEAHRLILELGGIPCYPVLADGTNPICPFEAPVEQLIVRIRSLGIHCAELIPERNSPEVLAKYVTAMRRAGLVVTGGTEHNTPELQPLQLRCADAQPISQEVKEIFREGACVVAAHQFLSLHGECGYVDAAGELNPACNSDEKRIGAFRALGAAVIARFQESGRDQETRGPKDQRTF
jgi:hypothetical protein